MQTGTPSPSDLSPPTGSRDAEGNLVPPRAPYAKPVLERLGPWEAFTLQMSIPIFP